MTVSALRGGIAITKRLYILLRDTDILVWTIYGKSSFINCI